ncbi:hypothetical protein PR003_g7138 [Phytophthora rubi]|uniref:PEP-utilising enzyme C-terminal domain-containing protein n=1 Tax=Phytophthora rubi TaxID=129364 RepID=A0A6A3NCI1_9STRA|nr:hypothetical protein PR002_g5896 [Phytophthora rubi]KAE9347024.1 hypothetical protein PR003_g7138 [Phytophthora rubi]
MPYVCGCSTLPIDANGRLMRVGTTRDAEDVLREGDYIGFSSVSGTTGEAIRARRIFPGARGYCAGQLCEPLSKEMKVSKALVQSRMSGLKEANPMMGVRGSRLGIDHHGHADQGYRGGVAGEGISVHLHIMILLVGSFEELEQEVKLVKAVV